MTMIDDITVNDGVMFLEIVKTELKKNVGKITGGQHTVYVIRGRDNLGEIDIIRRYSEFLFFRDMLFSRYPGVYIPPVPSKKAQGHKEAIFVDERRHFLDQFMKAICQMKYLASSPEMQIFLRPKL